MSRVMAASSMIFLVVGCGHPDFANNRSSEKPGASIDGIDLSPSSSGATVQVESGTLQGSKNSYGVEFLGIPYAKAPIGALRWQPPQAFGSWTGVRSATKLGSVCAQPQLTNHQVTGSEDCLFMNIWTPSTSGSRPVMFFIHGGSNEEGSSTDFSGITIYIGDQLAKVSNSVVVTFNYRLGMLGYLSHPALSAASSSKTSGNYGFMDQVAALQWVRRNVARFGGDPTKITVFGQSAGGNSVCHALTSPRTKGLFVNAIMESGGCNTLTLANNEQLGTKLVAPLCANASDILACLRNASIAQLIPLHHQVFGNDDMIFFPVVDGANIIDKAMNVIISGKHNTVPVIVGSNKAEMPSFMFSGVTDEASFNAELALYFKQESIPAIKTLYSASRFGSYANAVGALATDIAFTCEAQAIVGALASHQSQPVFNYMFDAMGSFHGAELFPLWQRLGSSSLKSQMSTYWGSMAKFGYPSADTWPRVNPSATLQSLQIGEQSQLISAYRDQECKTIYQSLLPEFAPSVSSYYYPPVK